MKTMTRIPFENIVSTIKKIATTTSSIINTTLTTFSTTMSSTFPTTTTTLRTTTRATTTTTTTTTMATTTVAPLPESHFFLFIGVFILICVLLVGLGVGSFYNLTLLIRKKYMVGNQDLIHIVIQYLTLGCWISYEDKMG